MRLALALIAALSPVTAYAEIVGPRVQDASFEQPAVTGGYAYNPTGSPWTFSGLSGIAANGSPFYSGNAPDGTQAAFLQSGSGSFGQITQTLTGLTIGSTYTFSFYEAQRPGKPANSIDVMFGSVDLGTTTPTSGDFSIVKTSSFIATKTSDILSFIGANTQQTDIDSAIDLVSINTVAGPPPASVPEPASLALLVTGLVAVAARRKRA